MILSKTSVLFYTSHYCFLCCCILHPMLIKRSEIRFTVWNDLSIILSHLFKYKPIFFSEGLRNLSSEGDELRVDILCVFFGGHALDLLHLDERWRVGLRSVVEASWSQGECLNHNGNNTLGEDGLVIAANV